MKERPILMSAPMVRAILDGSKVQTRRVVKPLPLRPSAGVFPLEIDTEGLMSAAMLARCPYGKPGDRLWVRETWRTQLGYDAYSPKNIPQLAGAEYVADGGGTFHGKSRPSIFMPRWASRITLEITAVRVERLQDISLGDCMAEGCPFPNMANGTDPKKWYADLWNSINGPAAWDKNPWIWCLTFRRIVEFKRVSQ